MYNYLVLATMMVIMMMTLSVTEGQLYLSISSQGVEEFILPDYCFGMEKWVVRNNVAEKRVYDFSDCDVYLHSDNYKIGQDYNGTTYSVANIDNVVFPSNSFWWVNYDNTWGKCNQTILTTGYYSTGKCVVFDVQKPQQGYGIYSCSKNKDNAEAEQYGSDSTCSSSPTGGKNFPYASYCGARYINQRQGCDSPGKNGPYIDDGSSSDNNSSSNDDQ
ncbi:hypothetical protein DFA_07376 [Cavenderia fasciculata]|uniref:Uncharacterized protein n=1 Tax=Cavenderia fasciculata TaxID=261658 RepID=F4PW89_CACFS|nr:uncharacterized protein DFA_07376 [Cavenderia fasciculata]EGG20253.1 hypothetical protein DFA_07376 [Cavenderia fasciculata]|eukprot:XP_004367236.1 hypothetical protein DFA_07376 [Cavenderia fasciculata]